LASYVEHHSPAHGSDDDDPVIVETAEGLLRLSPNLEPREALQLGLRFGFSVGALAGARLQDAGPQ
jgi:hypothetical protein